MNHVSEENIWLSGKVEIYTMMQYKVIYKKDLIEKTMMQIDYEKNCFWFFVLIYSSKQAIHRPFLQIEIQNL